MNETAGTATPPAAPVQAGGAARAEPLIDRMGRTYEQLLALGKKVLPRLNPRTRLFMPKSTGRTPGIKNKSKMDTATATPDTPQQPDSTPAAPSTTENGTAGSSTPPPSPSAAPAQPEIPGMAELQAALKNADDTPSEATPAGRKTGDEYTLAAAGTVSAISTVAILAMGAHVKPDQEQTVAMVEAYAACYRHYGYKPEAPPWLGPVVATAMWIGPHFADERSQTSLQKWKRKLTNAWLWVVGKIDGRAAAGAAGDTAR